MRFSTKCWSEHILSAYKATKNLKHPLYLTFRIVYRPVYMFFFLNAAWRLYIIYDKLYNAGVEDSLRGETST